jgi:hypothetical protein
MRSRFPIVHFLYVPCAAACTLLAGLALLPAPARAAQTPLLPTLTNNLAGTTTDIAGPADASSSPEQKRVWIAEGRVRTAIRISDRQRMLAEERSFSSSVSAETYEPLIALEVDDVNQRLYSLTKDALYREDISTPSSPSALEFYDFSPATGRPVEEVISSWEPAVDLKVWPQGGGITAIFVLTNKRLITLLDSGPGTDIVLAGWTSDMYDPYIPDPGNKILPRDHCSPVDIATLQVYKLQNLRVLEDQDNEVMAYVTAEMEAYAAGQRPFPRLVIACYLDSQNGYASPSFDLDPNPSRIHFYYWSPVPPPNPPPSGLNADKTIYSLDAFTLGSERYLYLACGKENQIKRVKVTGAYPKTDCSVWSPDQTHTANPGDHVYNVLADSAVPTRIFALSGSAAHIIDGLYIDPAVMTLNEPFGFGCRRDMLQIALPSPLAKTLWTAVDGYVDHLCKVLDVTSSPTTVPRIDEYFALLNCDGGVMIGTDVYLPTWNGLVRHRWIASESRWEVVPDSYKPAEVPPDSGIVFSTEHADAGFANGKHRVFIAPGLGKLMEFEIAPTLPHDPQDPNLFNPVISSSWPPAWHGYPNGSYYSNDVAFADLGPNDDQKFVLVDLTNFAVVSTPLTTQPALLAYRYDPVTPEWDHVATAFASPIVRQNPDAELTNTITIAPGVNSKWFAFVAHDMGFFSVDITNLTLPTPSMSIFSQVCSKTGPSGCEQGAAIAGLTVSMNRLFVYVNDTPKTIRIYEWDRSNGAILNLLQEYPQSYFLPPDPNPVDPSNATSGRCYRARFHTTNTFTGAGYAYFACEPYLLQMRWPGSGASTLDFTGWWRSDYEHALQDCRFYDVPGFASGILTVKDGESFALVGE